MSGVETDTSAANVLAIMGALNGVARDVPMDDLDRLVLRNAYAVLHASLARAEAAEAQLATAIALAGDARHAALEEAARDVAGIREDLAGFDGDRRSHVRALQHAEEVLAEIAVMIYCPRCEGRGYLIAGPIGGDILHCLGCDPPRGSEPDIRTDAVALITRFHLAARALAAPSPDTDAPPGHAPDPQPEETAHGE